MIWYGYLLLFLAGMLLTNAIPHFVQGLCGHPFQSPFAKPPGIGESSPLSNVYWGFANLAGGVALVVHWPIFGLGWVAISAGSLFIGTFVAKHFGAVRSGIGKSPSPRHSAST